MITAKWDITQKCNLRCKHCAVSDMYFCGNETYLSLDQKIRILNNLAAGGVTHLSLLGGEPLTLRAQLFTVIEEAKKLNINVSVVSNGVLLDPDTIKRLLNSGLDRLVTSIEGTSQPIHDAVRGHGTYAKIMSNIEQFNYIKNGAARPGLSINSVLTKLNRSTFCELPLFAVSLGASEWTALSLNIAGHALQNVDDLVLSRAEHTDVAKEIGFFLAEHAQSLRNLKVNLQITYPLVREMLIQKYAIQLPQPQICCSAASSLVYITPGGDAYVCDRVQEERYNRKPIADDHFHAVSLLVEDFSSVWRSRQYLETYEFVKSPRTYSTYYPCSECDYLKAGICNPCPLYTYDGPSAYFEECALALEELRALKNRKVTSETTWEAARRFRELDIGTEKHGGVAGRKDIPVRQAGVRYVALENGHARLMEPRAGKEVILNEICHFVWSLIDGVKTCGRIEDEVVEACDSALLTSEAASVLRVDVSLPDIGNEVNRAIGFLASEGFVQIANDEGTRRSVGTEL